MAKVKYSEFVDALDAAATLDGTETVVVIQDGAPVETTTQDIADLGGGAAAYLVYTALLTQTGTDAPVATVLQNTLGGTVVWTRDNSGEYTGTLAGAFTADKTLIFIGNNSGQSALCACYRNDANTVALITSSVDAVLADDILYHSIKIEVYP